MAKIQEQSIVIKISKLIKDDESDTEALMNPDDIESLEAVIRELSDQHVLIEIKQQET